MSMVITCDSCSKKLKLKAEHAGKKVRCPGCQTVLLVPAVSVSDEPMDAIIPEEAPRTRRKAKPEKKRTPSKRTPTRAPKVTTVDDDMWEDKDDDFDDDWDDSIDADDPYAPPPSGRSSRPRSSGSGRFSVDGKLIKCGKHVSLPKICVKTGAKKNLVAVEKTLKHSPGWAWLGGLILVLITQKSCEVTYYMSKAAKKQSTLLLTIGVVTFILGIGLCIGGAASQHELLVLPGLLMIIGGLITVMIGSAPVKISRRDGEKTFWLAGCKPAFLDQIGR